MSYVASSSSFSDLREHALSAAQRAALLRSQRDRARRSTRDLGVSHLLDTTNIRNLLRGMSQAIEVGGYPDRPLPPGAWDLMSSSPEVMRDGHDSEYLEAHGKVDAALTHPTHVLVNGLSGLNPAGADLASGPEHARQRNVPEALHAWGVQSRRARELVDRRYSLGFYSAVETLLGSDAVTRLPNSTQQRFTAAALTTILTREGRW
jgi:hypothetical protein